MSDQPRLYIAGIGMITPVGFDTASTAAAVRAGMSGYADTEYFDEDFNTIKMATVPELAIENCLNEELLNGELSARQARMLQLAKLALAEIVQNLPIDKKIPLFLSVPEQRGTTEKSFDRTFLENLVLQSGINLALAESRIISTGRAGGLSAIKLAFRYFESTDASVVLVGGIDSFYDKERLKALAAEKRLLCGETMDGFVPGEAAVFLMLTKELSYMNITGMPCIYEPGMGMENGHLDSTQIYTGDGLASAIRAALNQANVSKIGRVYTTMNGENFWAKEYGVAVIRNKEAIDETVKHEHPAEYYGDVGSASGPLLVALAAINALQVKTGLPSLVCCSSDSEHRGAVILQA